MVLDVLADSSLLYNYISTVLRKIIEREREREKRVCVRKTLSLHLVIWYLWVAIWNSERSLLLLDFDFAVWWFALSWCVATFGFDLWLFIWFVHNWYLKFVFGICEPLVLWFFDFVFLRELFGCIWDLGLWECLYTNLYYPKFIIMKFVRHPPWI